MTERRLILLRRYPRASDAYLATPRAAERDHLDIFHVWSLIISASLFCQYLYTHIHCWYNIKILLLQCSGYAIISSSQEFAKLNAHVYGSIPIDVHRIPLGAAEVLGLDHPVATNCALAKVFLDQPFCLWEDILTRMVWINGMCAECLMDYVRVRKSQSVYP
jgi:hypothetical protein